MNMEKEQFEKIKNKTKEDFFIENERFAKLEPKIPTQIDEWRSVVNDNFSDLALPAEVGLSVIAQLLIDDITNPFALVYVDVPSSGKTIALNFFSTIRELIYTTDNFTPASFVSHSANTKKSQLEKNDMLPQIRYKTLIIRDLAPIFAKRDEDVQAMLGILIRVLDGEGLETNSGLYGKRGYVGDYLFMLLSASTPIRPRIWKAMGNLGSRLFFLNIEGKEKDEETLANQLKNSCKDKELVCREITADFIKTLWQENPKGISWNKESDNEQVIKNLSKIAKVLARLRTAINVWEEYQGNKKFNHTQPITEMPDRLNQLLYNFARGHALICRRTSINNEDLKLVWRVAIDSGVPNRSKIFKELIKQNGELTTGNVMKKLNCSRPTALRIMQEMEILGIVQVEGNMNDDSDFSEGRPEQKITLRENYQWFVDNKELITTAE